MMRRMAEFRPVNSDYLIPLEGRWALWHIATRRLNLRTSLLNQPGR